MGLKNSYLTSTVNVTFIYWTFIPPKTFRSNIWTSTLDQQMSGSTKDGLYRPEYNIITTGTPDGGHITPEPSERKMDTSTTTNGTKTLKRISDGHISPIHTKLPNLYYPSKPHKQLTSPYQNKTKLQHLNGGSTVSEEKFTNFKSYIEENTRIDIFSWVRHGLTNCTNDSL